MSKEVDLTTPLTDAERAYLEQRSRHYDIEDNDRQFKVGKFADDFKEEYKGTNTVAPNPVEPGSDADNPPAFVGVRPHGVDRAVWGGATGLDAPSDDAPAASVDDLSVEELKDELKDRDLSTSGNKHELQKRLKSAVAKEA